MDDGGQGICCDPANRSRRPRATRTGMVTKTRTRTGFAARLQVRPRRGREEWWMGCGGQRALSVRAIGITIGFGRAREGRGPSTAWRRAWAWSRPRGMLLSVQVRRPPCAVTRPIARDHAHRRPNQQPPLRLGRRLRAAHASWRRCGNSSAAIVGHAPNAVVDVRFGTVSPDVAPATTKARAVYRPRPAGVVSRRQGSTGPRGKRG